MTDSQTHGAALDQQPLNLSVTNPADYLQVVRRLFFDPISLRAAAPERTLNQIALIIAGVFSWLPVFILALGRPLGALDTPPMLFSPWFGVVGVIVVLVLCSVSITPTSGQTGSLKAVRVLATILTSLMAVGIAVGIRAEGGFFEGGGQAETGLFSVAVGSGIGIAVGFMLLLRNPDFIRSVVGPLILEVGLIGAAPTLLMLVLTAAVGGIMGAALYPTGDNRRGVVGGKVLFLLLPFLANLALVRLVYFPQPF